MPWCMRTTLRLNDDLLRAAKEEAARSGRTLTQVFESALRLALSRRAPSAKAKAKPTRLPTFKGGGLRPGVDLDDGSALRDLMDGIE